MVTIVEIIVFAVLGYFVGLLFWMIKNIVSNWRS